MLRLLSPFYQTSILKGMSRSVMARFGEGIEGGRIEASDRDVMGLAHEV